MAERTITIGDSITVSELADKLEVGPAELVGALMKNGVMATLNDRIDFDTAAIIAADYECELEQEITRDPITELKSSRDLSEKAQERPPVVAVMGHVDHGKTTLLDSIRETAVAAGESGGITQHISAYQVQHKDRTITFLDTPGHSAFSALRQHGAALTDVAVIVVAANDGVMPQTKEAVEYAQRAGVRIVVAINKMDAEGADPNRVKQQLSELQLIPEDWGGDTVMVEVSALKKTNLDSLLEMILLVADIDELKADVDVPAEGIVIESHMSHGQGPVATVLVEHGELTTGSFIVTGGTYAKVRSLKSTSGGEIKSAGPSTPAVITGFKEVPVFGQRFEQVPSEKEARKLSTQAGHEMKHAKSGVVKSASGTDLLHAMETERAAQRLNIVLKADVQGSLESIITSLEDIGSEEIGVKVVASGVGDINESDISAAETAGAVIIGFHVHASAAVKRQALRSGVSIKNYTVIYNLIDETKEMLEKLLTPNVVETELGQLEIKGVFRTTNKRVVCGGKVLDGKLVSANTFARLERGEEVLGEAVIVGLQKGQDPVQEVFKDDLCGLELQTEEKIGVKEGDILRCIQRTEERATL